MLIFQSVVNLECEPPPGNENRFPGLQRSPFKKGSPTESSYIAQIFRDCN